MTLGGQRHRIEAHANSHILRLTLSDGPWPGKLVELVAEWRP
jgi:hypothetical protein